jgi:hypothetical protein
MPIEAIGFTLGITFISVWAYAGRILLRSGSL